MAPRPPSPLPHDGPACTCLLVPSSFPTRPFTPAQITALRPSPSTPTSTYHLVPHAPHAFPSLPFSRILAILRKQAREPYARIAPGPNPRPAPSLGLGDRWVRVVLEREVGDGLERRETARVYYGEAARAMLGYLRARFGGGVKRILGVWETVAVPAEGTTRIRERFEVDVCLQGYMLFVQAICQPHDPIALIYSPLAIDFHHQPVLPISAFHAFPAPLIISNPPLSPVPHPSALPYSAPVQPRSRPPKVAHTSMNPQRQQHVNILPTSAVTLLPPPSYPLRNPPLSPHAENVATAKRAQALANAIALKRRRPAAADLSLPEWSPVSSSTLLFAGGFGSGASLRASESNTASHSSPRIIFQPLGLKPPSAATSAGSQTAAASERAPSASAPLENSRAPSLLGSIGNVFRGWSASSRPKKRTADDAFSDDPATHDEERDRSAKRSTPSPSKE